MKVKKIILCLFLSSCLTLSAVASQSHKGSTVHAASLVSRQTAALSRSGAVLRITLRATGTASVKKIKSTFTLQKYTSGAWKKYFSWDRTADSKVLSVDKDYKLTEKGKYRIKFTATYYNSSTSSTSTVYSSAITY